MGKTFTFTVGLKGNWFFVAAALVLASDVLALQTPDWSSPRLLEIGLLSDLAIVVPGLYIACYWRKGKSAVLRAVALASLGFWSASKLLPESNQFLIPSLWPVRYVTLAVLMVIEFKIMLSMYRSVFGGASRRKVAESLQAQTGMPPWAAKLAAAEAAIWHAAYTKAKAIFRRWRS